MSGVPSGAKRLGPGVYALGREMHIDAEELCIHAGVPVTNANLEMLVRVAAKLWAEEGVPLEVRLKDES